MKQFAVLVLVLALALCSCSSLEPTEPLRELPEVSTPADRTWVRTVRLGPDALVDLSVGADGITIDERSYVYQSDGIPFVPAP